MKAFCEERGCDFAIAKVWEKGGEGGEELAQKVLNTLETKESNFKVLYQDDLLLTEKIETIAKEIYGAGAVTYSPQAERQLSNLEKLGFEDFRCVWQRHSIRCLIIRNYWEDRKVLR